MDLNFQSEHMSILFTRSNSLASRLICGVLDEPVSHVCFLVENAIIHSNFLGTHVDFKQRFLKENQVIYRVEIEQDFSVLQQRLEELLQSYSSYDFSAFFYFGWRAILKKYLGIPFPLQNKLNTPKAYLCTEFATMILNKREHGIISPYQLYLKLEEEGAKDGRILN